MSIVINIDKAKNIAHGIRRDARAKEFAPLDIKANIPADAVEAEASRQLIRDKYAEIQVNINTANQVNELTDIVKGLL